MSTPTATEILSRRIHCYTDEAGRQYQSLTLPADGWVMLESMLKQDQLQGQVRDLVRDIINCGNTVSEQCKIAQPLRLLCSRLGVTL